MGFYSTKSMDDTYSNAKLVTNVVAYNVWDNYLLWILLVYLQIPSEWKSIFVTKRWNIIVEKRNTLTAQTMNKMDYHRQAFELRKC